MLRKEDRELARQLGHRAREHRVRLPATQEEVAEMIGLSPQVYSRLERGGVLPSLPTFLKLCEALRTTPDALLIGDKLPSKLTTSRGAPELARLTRLLTGAEPRTVQILLRLARDISAKKK